MGKFDLDKYFKDRVKGHSEHYDTDALWRNLDLDNDKKDRKFLFWIVGFIPVVLMGSSILFFSNNQEIISELSSQQSPIPIEKPFTSNLETTSIEKPKKISSPIIANEHRIQENNKTEIIASAKYNATKNLKANKASFKNGKNATNKLKLVTETAFNINSYRAKSSTNITTRNTTSIAAKNNQEIIGNNSFKMSSKSQNFNVHLPVATLNPDYLIVSPLLFNNFRPKNIVILQRPAEIEVQKRKKEKLLSIELYKGCHSLNRSLTLNGTSEHQTILDKRNETETPLEMFSLGTNFNYEFSNGLYLKAGILFQSINEKFQYQRTTIDTIPIENQPIENFISEDGQKTVILGQGFGEQPTTESWNFYNNHRMLSLPIGLGYKLQHQRWSLFLEGSLIFNIHHKFHGIQLDQSLSPSEDLDYFSNNLKIGYNIGAGIAFAVSNNVELYFQPIYVAMPTNFIKKDFGLKQSYNMYGLNLGVKYRFDQ